MQSPLAKSGSVRQIASPLKKSSSVKQIVSPKNRDGSDVLDMSSPMSTDAAQGSPTENARATNPGEEKSMNSEQEIFRKRGSIIVQQRVSKPTPIVDRIRTTDSNRSQTPDSSLLGKTARLGEPRPTSLEPGKMLERLSSKNVKSKFHFRPSLQIEAQSPANQVGNTPSPFALEEAKLKAKESRPNVTFQVPDKGSEAHKEICGNEENEQVLENGTADKDTGDISVSRVTFSVSPKGGHEIEPVEAGSIPPANGDDERSKIFSFAPFGRSKTRPEPQKRKSKAERPRGMLNMSRSKSSHAAKKQFEQERLLDENSELSVPSPQNPQCAQEKGNNAVRGKKIGWFNLRKGENGLDRSAKQTETLRGRTKSRKEESAKDPDRRVLGPDFFARQASRPREESAVDLTPKGNRLARKGRKSNGILGFGISQDDNLGIDIVNADEYIVNSDDEERQGETQVRSLVVDDFISYQTKQSKKGKAKA